MISFSSDVWFRHPGDPNAEWARGCVSGMQETAPAKSAKSKVAVTRFSLQLQDEGGEATGEAAELCSALVEGSFEEFDLVKLRNPTDDDPEAACGIEDLISLNHLHEPAILTCLKGRFDSNLIYTNTGPILIAVVRIVFLHFLHIFSPVNLFSHVCFPIVNDLMMCRTRSRPSGSTRPLTCPATRRRARTGSSARCTRRCPRTSSRSQTARTGA
jgi:hypothetical protein